jgi:hypothetical protein
MNTYTYDDVLAYFTEVKKYRNFNWTSDEFKMYYTAEGFIRDEDSGLFTNPTLDPETINKFYKK